MSDNQPDWYETPAATALIEALFKLDAIAASLEQFGAQFGGEDPVCMIGQFREKMGRIGLASSYGRRWEVTGSSATESCFNALGNIRSAWIEAKVGAKWSAATQAETDLLMQGEEDTPSVNDAINAYVRGAINLRRVA